MGKDQEKIPGRLAKENRCPLFGSPKKEPSSGEAREGKRALRVLADKTLFFSRAANMERGAKTPEGSFRSEDL
jgi:hypothetical protein